MSENQLIIKETICSVRPHVCACAKSRDFMERRNVEDNGNGARGTPEGRDRGQNLRNHTFRALLHSVPVGATLKFIYAHHQTLSARSGVGR